MSKFLAKPAAANFAFLAPLLSCARPSSAKAAFFSGLPALRTAIAATHSHTVLTPDAAHATVRAILDLMDKAAKAGRPK